MEDHPVADSAPLGNCYMGMEQAVVANMHVVFHNNTSFELHPLSYADTMANADLRANAHLLWNVAVVANNRAGMDTCGLKGFGQEKTVDAGNGNGCFCGDQTIFSLDFAARRHNTGTGSGRLRLWALLGVENIGDLSGPGQLQAV